MSAFSNLIKRSVLLFVLIAVWVGVLWFGIRLDISRFNLLGLIGLHAGPPILAWASWSIWRRRSEAAKIKTKESEQEQAEAAQKTQHESAQRAFEETMRMRHFALDCRWAAVYSSQPDLVEDGTVALMPSSDGAASERLLASLSQLLPDLFESCPAARGLPIYIAESPTLDYAQAARVVAGCCHASNLPPIMALPASTTPGVADAIFSRFESDPHLPGALFLAVDGPDVPCLGEDDDDQDDLTAQPKQADAMVALLFTHPNLDTALADIITGAGRAENHQYDPMTPFWERNQRQLQGLSERLARLPEEVRTSLPELPVLGQLRRPVEVSGKNQNSAWRNAIERALINANLKQLSFEVEKGTVAATKKDTEEDIPCAWVVHNAGSYETSGDTLSLLGTGLSAHGIDLNIIRQATNVQADVKLGAVDQWASVALALTQSQALHTTTLWATFGACGAVGFVTNAKT